MVRAGAPKPLWADCIEFEAYVQSHTAWDIYKLGSQDFTLIQFGLIVRREWIAALAGQLC